MANFILMATYNGADFLAAQLESILSQARDWQLLVRDDGSGDGTRKILREHAAAGAPITMMDNATVDSAPLGPRDNFARLLTRAAELGADYCVLSDQDDVWHPDKLALQAGRMQQLEQEFPGAPILLHTDLEVVDRQLSPIHPSFMACQGIRHENRDPLRVLLCQNFVTGSTVIINRPLLQLALPLPATALMHDWWLALNAAVFGRLEFLPRPLVKYRQHGRNEIGVKNIRRLFMPGQRNWLTQWRTGMLNLQQSFLQARTLAERIRSIEPENPHLPLVEAYAVLADLPPAKRIMKLKKLGIHMQAAARQALLFSRLLFCQKSI